MDFLKFDAAKCTLCGKCIDKCPFGALSIEAKGIAVGDACRMCGMCVRSCPEGPIRFEQRANTVDKSKWIFWFTSSRSAAIFIRLHSS